MSTEGGVQEKKKLPVAVETYGYGEEFKVDTASEASNDDVGSKAESEVSILERFQKMNLIQEKIWPGPFSPLNEREGLAQGVTGGKEGETPDVHMETVKSLSQTMRPVKQGDIPDWVGMLYRNQQAPAPPVPPKYKGRTKKDRLEFMRAYETYLLVLENQRRSGFSPYVAPIASCIEEGTLRDLADFYFMKSPMYITEDDWAKYFLDARLPEGNFYSVRKSFEEDVEKNLRLKLTYGDAESCLAIYRRDLDALLEKHNLYYYMRMENPQRLTEIMVNNLEPPAFKDIIKMYVKEPKIKKKCKGNPLETNKLIQEKLKDFLMMNPDAVKTVRVKERGKDTGKVKEKKKDESRDRPLENKSSGERVRFPCLKCGSKEHMVRQCPQLGSSEEAEKLIQSAREKRQGQQSYQKKVQMTKKSKELGKVGSRTAEYHGTSKVDTGRVSAWVDGVEVEDVLLDSGADDSLVSRGLVEKVKKTGAFVREATPKMKMEAYPVGNQKFDLVKKVKFEVIRLSTSQGPLVVRDREFWVHEENKGVDLTIGRPEMNRMGYTTDALLTAARAADMGRGESTDKGVTDSTGKTAVVDSPILRISSLQMKALRAEPERDGPDEKDTRVATPEVNPSNEEDVLHMLEKKVKDAEAAGLDPDLAKGLEELLKEHVDEFRLTYGQDPPVQVKPLRVTLRADVTPVKAKCRRLAPVFQVYLEGHMEELVKFGLMYLNNDSQWSSAPRIVAKKEPGAYRMTVDLRAVNALTVPIIWPMPLLEVMLERCAGATCFFQLDLFSFYWQLPLHKNSQEIFSVITHRGIFTPTRVPMGATDAVAYCQSVVDEIFGKQIDSRELLAWLDDLLGYAKTQDDLLGSLRRVLAECKRYGMKLHAGKCTFFTKVARWVGKVISAEGVSHSPERVSGLVQMRSPKNAGELQQFLCAVNWMRMNIPEFSKITAKLYEVLERAANVVNSRKKNKLLKVQLTDVGWEGSHEEELQKIKQVLLKMVPLSHALPENDVCLFTDASLDHWGAIVTQVPPADSHKPIGDQKHQPLAFLSGKFTGAAARWPIIEKEAFAIVESCKRLEYLLLRPRGFKLYTDHRNLVYIFDPLGFDGGMARYQADKLQRWAMTLTMFRYEIEHVSGEDNVWGDLLSRWGAQQDPPVARMAQLAVVQKVSPLQDKEFDWPTQGELVEVQLADIASRDEDSTMPECSYDSDDGLYKTDKDQIWIPDQAAELQQRLLVVAHAGVSGHFGEQATLSNLQRIFYWSSMESDVKVFMRACLHCIVAGPKKIPRPYGPALHATKPNELLHWDFLTLPQSETGSRYVLVLRDDMSGFVEFNECSEATAEMVLAALMDWFSRFGVVYTWVTDQGTHFKNQLIEHLRKQLGAHHHFTLPYCPWSNGTVEVVNRLLLRCLKALLSERKMQESEWPKLLKLVQMALNGRPSPRLKNQAPVTAMTALPADGLMKAIVKTKPVQVDDVQVVWSKQQEHMEHLCTSLELMHRECAEESEKLRKQARLRREKKSSVHNINFQEGDFVLVAAVGAHANKLAATWKGPRRIVQALSEYVYEVQNLIAPYEVTKHHVSRIHPYAESKRGVTEDLIEQAQHSQGGHYVESIVDCRIGPNSHDWEMQIKWVGLDPEEASWEPAKIIFEDIPKIVELWCDQQKDNPKVQAMWNTLQGKERLWKTVEKASKAKRKGGK